jgi:hypothetical protein
MLTQQTIITKICKTVATAIAAYPVSANSKTIRVDVATNTASLRKSTALAISSLFQGSVIDSSDPNTVLLPEKFKVIVKPKQGAVKTGSSAEYGLLGQIDLSAFKIAGFETISNEFSRGKLPTNIKEDSDVKGVSDLNTAILPLLGRQVKGITLRVNGMSFSNVVGCIPVTIGEPKADFVFVSVKPQTMELYPSGFISYKLGRDAKGFQNYSGLSEKSSPTIFNNEETISFYKKLETLQNSGNKKSAYSEIKNNSIVASSIWGMNFGRQYGVNNVHFLAQGEVTINSSSLSYTHTQKNGDFNFSDGYEPVFGARYTPSRNNVGPNGIRVTGMRLGIFPAAYFTSGRDALKI